MTKIEAMIEVLNGDFKVKAKSPLGNFITLTHTGTLTWNHKVELVTCDNLHAEGYKIVKDEIGMRIFHEQPKSCITCKHWIGLVCRSLDIGTDSTFFCAKYEEKEKQ